MTAGAPIRVAQVLGEMNTGGVESIILGYYRAIDRTQIQFDFFVDEASQLPFRAEMEAMGARIFMLPSLHKPQAYVPALRALLQENDYPIVHANANTLNVFPLYAAWLAKVPVRINHSHSTASLGEGARSLAKYVLRPSARTFATDFFACGHLAGQWLFGTKAMHQKKVHIAHNAIDLGEYAYDANMRHAVREALSLGDGPVIGHVGRFCYPKNHDFLLRMFAALAPRLQDARLMLIGDGETMPAARALAKTLRIEDRVLFLGARDDIPRLLSAMDLFAMPSRYEGLPVVGVEAQAAGLPCLFSTRITPEVGLTADVRFLPLRAPEAWAQAALELLTPRPARTACLDLLAAQGYDIHQEVEALSEQYLRMVQSLPPPRKGARA